ncbi:MAG: ParA family protein [Verrucomicrobiota bacterium]
MSSAIALVSQKGGVGKTTIAVNLSYSLARRGWRILLVDADVQGGVGFSLTKKAKDSNGFLDLLATDVIPDEEEVRRSILETNLEGLDLMTHGSKPTIDRALSLERDSWISEERIAGVDRLLRKLDYNLVIYDTPTGMGVLSMGLCASVDHVLVPQRPDPICLRTLPQVLRMVASIRAESENDRPRLAGFVLSISDPDDPSSLDDQREFRDLLPAEMVFETVIPEHLDFREASRAGIPVALLRERPSPSSLIFDQLAAELEGRIEGEVPESLNPSGEGYARLLD